MSTIAIVQCRYSSSRFRGKALADLSGKPVVQHVIERANRIVGVSKVVLAIPGGDEEKPLRDWAVANAPCAVFVGSSTIDVNDVLNRFVTVASLYPKAKWIVRLTGDTPLLDPVVAGDLVALIKKAGDDHEYGWLDTHSGSEWPDGLDVECFSSDWLRESGRVRVPAHREHVTIHIRNSTAPKTIPCPPMYKNWPKCSIDTPEDLERVRQMMAVQHA